MNTASLSLTRSPRVIMASRPKHSPSRKLLFDMWQDPSRAVDQVSWAYLNLEQFGAVKDGKLTPQGKAAADKQFGPSPRPATGLRQSRSRGRMVQSSADGGE